MRRLLACLLTVSLLVASCAAAELSIFAADSLSQTFSIQDQQPVQWSKGHPCVEHAHLGCEGPPPDWASDFNARERFVLAQAQRPRI